MLLINLINIKVRKIIKKFVKISFFFQSTKLIFFKKTISIYLKKLLLFLILIQKIISRFNMIYIILSLIKF